MWSAYHTLMVLSLFRARGKRTRRDWEKGSWRKRIYGEKSQTWWAVKQTESQGKGDWRKRSQTKRGGKETVSHHNKWKS